MLRRRHISPHAYRRICETKNMYSVQNICDRMDECSWDRQRHNQHSRLLTIAVVANADADIQTTTTMNVLATRTLIDMDKLLNVMGIAIKWTATLCIRIFIHIYEYSTTIVYIVILYMHPTIANQVAAWRSCFWIHLPNIQTHIYQSVCMAFGRAEPISDDNNYAYYYYCCTAPREIRHIYTASQK